jgi:hypothetical protein
MIKKIGIVLLLMGTMGSIAYARNQAADYREAARVNDSIVASLDTARMVAVAQGDSAVQLLIVQRDLQRDSLDELLQQESALRLEAELRMDTLRIVDTVAAPVPEDTVEVYEFGGKDGPFNFLGSARLFPDRTQIFQVSVVSDPVPVHARVTCGDGRAFRSASVLLQADDPFKIVPSGVEADPDVCNARQPMRLVTVTKEKLIWGIAGAAVGFIVAHFTDDGFREANY